MNMYKHLHMKTNIQCEAPKITKLVNITPNVTMVYGMQITK